MKYARKYILIVTIALFAIAITFYGTRAIFYPITIDKSQEKILVNELNEATSNKKLGYMRSHHLSIKGMKTIEEKANSENNNYKNMAKPKKIKRIYAFCRENYCYLGDDGNVYIEEQSECYPLLIDASVSGEEIKIINFTVPSGVTSQEIKKSTKDLFPLIIRMQMWGTNAHKYRESDQKLATSFFKSAIRN